MTFSLFPSFGQFATETCADDIRILKLSFLKAYIIKYSVLNIFPGHEGGSFSSVN